MVSDRSISSGIIEPNQPGVEGGGLQGTQGDFSQGNLSLVQSVHERLQLIGSNQHPYTPPEDPNAIKEEPEPSDSEKNGEIAELLNTSPVDGSPRVSEKEDSDRYSDYYNNFHDQESSMIFEGEKLFDQPKRAKYGIKKAKSEF